MTEKILEWFLNHFKYGDYTDEYITQKKLEEEVERRRRWNCSDRWGDNHD